MLERFSTRHAWRCKSNRMIPVLFPSTHEFRFAGSDTTTIAMRAVFYFLLRDNESYRRVQKEIDDASAAGSLSNPPQYSESLDLPILCACIKEAMRLHLSVGLTMPRTVPGGRHYSLRSIPCPGLQSWYECCGSPL